MKKANLHESISFGRSPVERALRGTRIGLLFIGLLGHQKSPIIYQKSPISRFVVRLSKEPYSALVQSSFVGRSYRALL